MKPASGSSKWWEIFWRPKKKIEITMETKKTLKMRRLTTRVTHYCSRCEEDTFFLSLDDARDVFRGETGNLELFLSGERLHLKDLKSERGQICFNSLRDEIEKCPDGDSRLRDSKKKAKQKR